MQGKGNNRPKGVFALIYFTSDLHFYHEKIIAHVNRPFANEEEMNRALTENWNSRVQPDDDVYILGDVTLKGRREASAALSQLRGRKYLIRGNHDGFERKLDETQTLFVWRKDYHELVWNDRRFVLFHYPIVEWNEFFRGAIHLHGHQHNPPAYNEENRARGLLRYDVGVDANGMAPVSAEEILAFFEASKT